MWARSGAQRRTLLFHRRRPLALVVQSDVCVCVFVRLHRLKTKSKMAATRHESANLLAMVCVHASTSKHIAAAVNGLLRGASERGDRRRAL